METTNLADEAVMRTLTMPHHALQEDGKPLVLSREERVRLFGIDCYGPYGDGITYRGGEWTPGGEYVQTLKVKNVSLKLKKLKYKAPATKYFSLAFPELIILSPGTSEDIQVVFRPIVSEVYEDTIYFKIEGMGELIGFHVPVRAYISTLQICIPKGLDFGLVPTAVVSSRTFYLENTGQVPAPFEWEVPPPFRLAPDRGVVPVGHSCPITATLLPDAASVFVSQAVCTAGRGVNAIKPDPVQAMKLSAIGKYAHLAFSEGAVDFGEVYVGGVYKGREGKKEEQPSPAGAAAAAAGTGGGGAAGAAGVVTKEVVLHNRSLVEAHFASRRREGDRDPVFVLEPTQGVVQPRDSRAVKVSFKPRFAGTFSLDTYEFFTPGGAAAALQVSGQAVSPEIELYKKEDPKNPGVGLPDSVNFRDVVVGETATRVLFLRNPSPLPAYYCFVNVLCEDGIFTFDQTRGVIPPQLDTHVKLFFTPAAPSNYYRRVFCLVENQYPLFVDLMGTGYVAARGDVKEQRPAPLRQAHVQAFRNRVAAGLGRMGPEELDLQHRRDGPGPLFANLGLGGTAALATARARRPVTRSGEAPRDAVAVAQEFFADPTAEGGEVVISHEEIDFGFCRHNSQSDRRSFTVTNNTNAKVMVLFATPSDPDHTDGRLAAGAFEVTPDSADIGPRRSAEFHMTFSPTAHSRYYAQQVEAYVFFKSQRTFRLVTDATLSPPWCFPLRVAGHTFAGDPFLSKVQFNAPERKLAFPACFVGDAVYQSLRLTNRGNTPAFFQFARDGSGVFAVKPSSGLVPAEDFQIVLVRFRPAARRTYRGKLVCDVNGHAQTVALFGQGDAPRLAREGAKSMGEAYFLRPTGVGMAATGQLRLRNASRLPLVLSADLPASAAGVFAVAPRLVRLRGNEAVDLRVTFAPREARAHTAQLSLRVRPLAGAPPDHRDARQLGVARGAPVVQAAAVPLIGPGAGGALEFDPPRFDFGVALVNTTVERPLRLINQSGCDLAYELLYCLTSPEDREGRRLEVRPIPRGAGGGNLLAVDKPSGVLPARSATLVRATFQPHRDGLFRAVVTCRISQVDARTGERVLASEGERRLLALGEEAREDAAELALERAVEAQDAAAARGDATPPVPEDLPLSCHFQGRASFPQLVFRDACVEGGGAACAPAHLWRDLGLADLNRLMATPLTRAEVKFNLDSSPDLSRLPRFPLPFVPCAQGSPAQVILLEVCNPGFLTTSFEVHLPNEKDIEMETWADEKEPTEEELQMNAIIDNLKCFEIMPKRGTLEPGETLQLRLSYAYTSLEYGGVHNLPIHFRVMQGKQYWLDLKGVTLEPSASNLHMPLGAAMEFNLSPVAIGLPLGQAPFQTTEIFNTGLADMDYEIDVTPLEDLWRQHHGVRILELENPGGTLFGQQPLLLRWKFFPLEAREYAVRLKIMYKSAGGGGGGGGGGEGAAEGAREREFTVRAAGYDPRRRDPYTEELPDANKGLCQPAAQMMRVESQVASLSVDRLFLGRVPQRAKTQRVVVLRNRLPGAPVEYCWDTGHYPMLEVRPSSGVLAPGDLQVLRVVLRADATPPCVLDAHLALEVRQLPAPQDGQAKRKPKSRLESRLSQTRLEARKLGRTAHQSVVGKTTRVRNQRLVETQPVDGNRTATLPSDHKTFNATASRVEMSQSGPAGLAAAHSTAKSVRLDEFMHQQSNKSFASAVSASPAPPGTAKVTRFESQVTFGHGAEASALTLGQASGVASLAAPGGGGGAPAFLYLSVHGEVVDEGWWVRLLAAGGGGGAAAARRGVYVPAPRRFVAGSPCLDPPGGAVTAAGNALPPPPPPPPPPPAAAGKRGSKPPAPAPPTRPTRAEGAAFAREALARMFQEILGEAATRERFAALPAEEPVPYWRDIKAPTLMERFVGTLKALGSEPSKKMSKKELLVALKQLGCKRSSSGLRSLFKDLATDSSHKVDVELYINTLPTKTRADISLALTEKENEIIQSNKREAVEEQQAAVRIQSIARRKQAKQEVEKKKRLATEEGKREDAAATKIQAIQRRRAAQKRVEEVEERRLREAAAGALREPAFREAAWGVLENTVFNLLQEACHGEFDFYAMPKQYVLAEELQNNAGEEEDSKAKK